MALRDSLFSIFSTKNSSYKDEKTLVNALIQGHKGAFDYLYEKSWPPIYSYIVNQQQCSDDDAKDIFQTAILELFEKIRRPGFTLTAKVSSYLFTVAKYQCWRMKRKRGLPTDYAPDPAYNPHADEDDPLDDLLILIEDDLQTLFDTSYLPGIDEVLNFVKQMGPPCSDMLLDHFLAQVSFEEMSIEMNTKAGTIRKQSFDCRKRVKRHFTTNW